MTCSLDNSITGHDNNPVQKGKIWHKHHANATTAILYRKYDYHIPCINSVLRKCHFLPSVQG